MEMKRPKCTMKPRNLRSNRRSQAGIGLIMAAKTIEGIQRRMMIVNF